MAPETALGIVVVAALVLSIVVKLVPKRRPATKIFTCSRCRAVTPHNNRTIEAWRNGKTKFYCQACHAVWLQSHPPHERPQSGLRSSSGNTGCLGFAVLFALVPLSGLLTWLYA
ncbi:MAG: hypothetical protein JSS45_08825 [Proteobacteria bacterium]|nr:hypothetical protein [Pseudomonadota bacterium]